MSRAQRSIPLSPFFSLILIMQFMVCISYGVRASQPSPFFDYSPDKKINNITRGLPEEILKHLISYLPQKDATSLSLTSKTVERELKTLSNKSTPKQGTAPFGPNS